MTIGKRVQTDTNLRTTVSYRKHKLCSKFSHWFCAMSWSKVLIAIALAVVSPFAFADTDEVDRTTNLRAVSE